METHKKKIHVCIFQFIQIIELCVCIENEQVLCQKEGGKALANTHRLALFEKKIDLKSVCRK